MSDAGKPYSSGSLGPTLIVGIDVVSSRKALPMSIIWSYHWEIEIANMLVFLQI